MKMIKSAKKLSVALIALVVAVLAVMGFAACGNDYPSSYDFKGQIVSAQSGGSADLTMTLKDDKTFVFEASMGGGMVKLGTWSGTWKQNKDGTVTVTFKSKASDTPVAENAPAKLEINDNAVDADANPGMGGLTITSTVTDSVNKFEIKTIVYVGDGLTYPMPMNGSLTQVVTTAA